MEVDKKPGHQLGVNLLIQGRFALLFFSIYYQASQLEYLPKKMYRAIDKKQILSVRISCLIIWQDKRIHTMRSVIFYSVISANRDFKHELLTSPTRASECVDIVVGSQRRSHRGTEMS